jgi:hypothetical protein
VAGGATSATLKVLVPRSQIAMPEIKRDADAAPLKTAPPMETSSLATSPAVAAAAPTP